MGEKNTPCFFLGSHRTSPGFCPFFQGSSPSGQATFSLLQRSLIATTLHKPQVPKATPLMHLMTLKYWTEAEFAGCTGGPQTEFLLCLPSTCRNISASWVLVHCLQVGSESPTPQIIPVCITGRQAQDNARGHSYWLQCCQQQGPVQAVLTTPHPLPWTHTDKGWEIPKELPSALSKN